MRIPDGELNKMFILVGISKELLHEALRKMGTYSLKPYMREGWSEVYPTYGYCYVVSEFIYWYVAPKGTKPYSVKVPGDPGTHRFLRWPDTTIIDLTCDQFPNYALVPYEKAKVTPFMQTGCKGPSKRAKELAQLLGYDVAAWRKP